MSGTFRKLTIDDLEVEGLRVLVRVDFNVPLEEEEVTDATRIEATLPTIEKLVEGGGRLALMSHLGRPDGERDPSMSLEPVAVHLAGLLGREVVFVPDCIGAAAEEDVSLMEDGDVLLLENLRFHEGEQVNDPEFAAALARMGDVYVNDAFGTAHRAHASTEGVTRHFKQRAAGYLMARELEYLGAALQEPARPFAAVLGGAKISGKIDVIRALREKVDHLFIGGGMAFTFFKAKGLEVGRSLVEEERVEMAAELLEVSERGEGAPIHLPPDVVAAAELEEGADHRVVKAEEIPSDLAGYDIGPATLEEWRPLLLEAGTIVWNGPMGVFEVPPFDGGTERLGRVIAEATEGGALSIIGGGDSAAAVARAGLTDRMSHVSTGGGASLEFLEGKTLPGVAALSDRE
ncbi:MAG: phosphoglycerate kinase [bacterium]